MPEPLSIMFALCYSNQRKLVHILDSLPRHKEVSLLSWNCESKTVTTDDVWHWNNNYDTMCDLMDQFPTFMFRNQIYICLCSEIRQRIFSSILLRFSILRFYNNEKHNCSFHYQLNQLWLVSIDSLCEIFNNSLWLLTFYQQKFQWMLK